MPILLPLAPGAGELPTPYGRVTVSSGPGTVRVAVEGQGEMRQRIRLEPSSQELPEDEEPPPLLARVLDDRILVLGGGALRVDDAWSRLVSPYDPANVDPLKTLFAREDLTDEELRALPAPASAAARLTVFDASDVPAERLRARLWTPQGLLSMLPPGTRAQDVREDADGWSWRLREDEEGPARSERVSRTGDGLSVECEGGSIERRVYAVEDAAGSGAPAAGARLTLTATLASEVPPMGLGESVRKTLVFHLASELIALGRP